MVQRTTPAHNPEAENTGGETTVGCCHHWVIQPADGPISSGSCQICGESREFKNYVESATWGDSRTTGNGSSAKATTESTSDDEEPSGQDSVDDEPAPGFEPESSEMESED